LPGGGAGVGWARRRDPSLLWLALAIVLLSLVSLLGRIPALLHVTPPGLSQVSLIVFVGSGYALLRYRSSLLPLPTRWHAMAVAAMAAASVAFVAAQGLTAAKVVPASLQ